MHARQECTLAVLLFADLRSLVLTPSELGGKLALALAYTAVAAVKAQRTSADLRCTPGALQTLHGEPAGAVAARLLGGPASRPGLQGLRCADWPRSAWTRLAPYVYLVRMTQGELVLWPGQEVVSWGLVLEGELERTVRRTLLTPTICHIHRARGPT